MREQPVWHWLGLVPLATGVLWLAAAFRIDWAWLLLLIPGCVLVGAGMGLLLWPGDRRIPQTMAASVLPSALLALLAAWLVGPVWCVTLLATCVVTYFAAGYASLFHEPLTAGVPRVEITPSMAAKVALDDALLGYFVTTARVPAGAIARRMHGESEQIASLYQSSPWRSDVRAFHRMPGSVDTVSRRARRIYGQSFDHLSFPSRYEPWPGDLGADQWLQAKGNRITHAWAVRHPGPPRPWLVCIHGYRMGWPALDFMLFNPRWLHHRLGLNLLMPVLPLHGPRKRGWRSGDGYIDGDFPDFIHAEAQAMHDIRSWIRWLRESADAPAIGVLGFSLGGYNAALLANLEADLRCVIAGIPAVDIMALLWRHLPLLQLRYLESIGFTNERAADALRVVSPLAMSPLVARDRLHIFGGTADRLIVPSEVLRLARHWQTDVVWYAGTHLSFRTEPQVSRCIHEALEKGGLIIPRQDATRLAPGNVRQ